MARRRLKASVPRERLSHSEWEIMRICWRLSQCTARQVLEEDQHRPKRDYRTILTFMTRMANKGWLDVEQVGRTNYYTPAVPREPALTLEIERFLEGVVGSDPADRDLLRRLLGSSDDTVQRRR